MTNRSMPVASLTAAVMSLVLIQSPAFAQQAAEPQPVQNQSAATGAGAAQSGQAISDSKLQAFVVAYLQVDKVRQDYSTKIGAAPDATAKQKLQNEANRQMIKAVEGSPDMSLEEYKTIIGAAQTDPAVARKVQEKLQVSPPPVAD